MASSRRWRAALLALGMAAWWLVASLDTATIGAAIATEDRATKTQTVTEALGVGVSQLGENLVLRRAYCCTPRSGRSR